MKEIDFIRDTISAAHNLGIWLRQEGDHFDWMDMATNVIIQGPPDPGKSTALFKACESLIDYLNLNRETANHSQFSKAV